MTDADIFSSRVPSRRHEPGTELPCSEVFLGLLATVATSVLGEMLVLPWNRRRCSLRTQNGCAAALGEEAKS